MLTLCECFHVTCLWSRCEITSILLADGSHMTWKSCIRHHQLLIGWNKTLNQDVWQHLILYAGNKVTIVTRDIPFRGNSTLHWNIDAMGTLICITPYWKDACMKKKWNHLRCMAWKPQNPCCAHRNKQTAAQFYATGLSCGHNDMKREPIQGL